MNDIQHQWGTWMKEAVEARRREDRGRLFAQPAGHHRQPDRGFATGHGGGLTSPVDFFAGVDPRFGVFSAPVLFKDMAQAEKMLDPAQSRHPVAGAEWACRWLGLHLRLRTTWASRPAQLDDFRARSSASTPPRRKAPRCQFGAVRGADGPSEVIPGLQQGIIDGTQR